VVHWQTYKGWVFVGLSSLVIYGLVARSAQQNQVAKNALAESEKRYRLLFENNPLPMWVYDAETLEILEVNEAAVAQYQYPRSEFLQLSIKEIRPAEDVPLLLDNLAQVGEPAQFCR
jgi:PAS domain-containing protein